MDLSLSKFPWYGQIGAFVVVCALAVFGFWKFYVSDMQADIEARQTRLTALRADISKGVATARRLPQFQADVTQLEQRLESLRAVLPEEKDVADILRRVQGLATRSSLNIQRFTPQPPQQETLYAALPDKPGLGVTLNEAVVKQHLVPNTGYFEPTNEWNVDRTNDRLWS